MSAQELFTPHELDLFVGCHNQLCMFSQLVAQIPTPGANEAAQQASATAFALQQLTHACEPGVHMTKLTKAQVAGLIRSVVERATAHSETAPVLLAYSERLTAALEKAAGLIDDGTIAIPCACATPQERLEAAAQMARPTSSTIILPGQANESRGVAPGGRHVYSELD